MKIENIDIQYFVKFELPKVHTRHTATPETPESTQVAAHSLQLSFLRHPVWKLPPLTKVTKFLQKKQIFRNNQVQKSKSSVFNTGVERRFQEHVT